MKVAGYANRPQHVRRVAAALLLNMLLTQVGVHAGPRRLDVPERCAVRRALRPHEVRHHHTRGSGHARHAVHQRNAVAASTLTASAAAPLDGCLTHIGPDPAGAEAGVALN